jgi:hypothetical protein
VAARKKAAAKKKRKQMTPQPPRETKGPGGRPSSFTPELGHEICERLAEGESLLRMCEDDHMPWSRTVRRWMLGQGIPEKYYEEFSQNYAKARLSYEDCVFEKLDSMPLDVKLDPQRAKIWSENTKWSLKNMNRAKFSDRQDLGISGVPGAPPVTTSNVNINLANLSSKDQAKLRELARQAIGEDE